MAVGTSLRSLAPPSLDSVARGVTLAHPFPSTATASSLDCPADVYDELGSPSLGPDVVLNV